MILASVWLGLSAVLCLYAWIAARRLAAILLPLSVAIAAGAIYVPTGSPRLTRPPPGKYTIVGAEIEVDIAIWALLKLQSGPAVYYRLPYSNNQANALQSALDASQGGQNGAATAEIGQDGGASYDGPRAPAGLPPKQAEQPAVSIP